MLPRHLRKPEPPEAPFDVHDPRRPRRRPARGARDLQLLRRELHRHVRRGRDDPARVEGQVRLPAQARHAVPRRRVAERASCSATRSSRRGSRSAPTATRSRTRSTSARPPRARASAGRCSTSSSTRSKAAGLKEIIAVIADQGAEASIALHEKFGFEEIGRMGRVGFKFDRWLGTVLLQKSLK